MFLHLSVILFTGRGCLPQCMLGYIPPGKHTPRSIPPGSTPPEAHTPKSTPSPGKQSPPPRTVTAAGGTHPTGMLSCLGKMVSFVKNVITKSLFYEPVPYKIPLAFELVSESAVYFPNLPTVYKLYI